MRDLEDDKTPAGSIELGHLAEDISFVTRVLRAHIRARNAEFYRENGRRLTGWSLRARLVAAVVHVDVRDVAWAEMSRDDANAHVDLWRDVVRRTPLDLSAAPAALLGFAAWLGGDGALAWCAVDRCQEAEPDYTMAALLTDALASATDPARWENLPAEALTLFGT